MLPQQTSGSSQRQCDRAPGGGPRQGPPPSALGFTPQLAARFVGLPQLFKPHHGHGHQHHHVVEGEGEALPSARTAQSSAGGKKMASSASPVAKWKPVAKAGVGTPRASIDMGKKGVPPSGSMSARETGTKGPSNAGSSGAPGARTGANAVVGVKLLAKLTGARSVSPKMPSSSRMGSTTNTTTSESSCSPRKPATSTLMGTPASSTTTAAVTKRLTGRAAAPGGDNRGASDSIRRPVTSTMSTSPRALTSTTSTTPSKLPASLKKLVSSSSKRGGFETSSSKKDSTTSSRLTSSPSPGARKESANQRWSSGAGSSMDRMSGGSEEGPSSLTVEPANKRSVDTSSRLPRAPSFIASSGLSTNSPFTTPSAVNKSTTNNAGDLVTPPMSARTGLSGKLKISALPTLKLLGNKVIHDKKEAEGPQGARSSKPTRPAAEEKGKEEKDIKTLVVPPVEDEPKNEAAEVGEEDSLMKTSNGREDESPPPGKRNSTTSTISSASKISIKPSTCTKGRGGNTSISTTTPDGATAKAPFNASGKAITTPRDTTPMKKERIIRKSLLPPTSPRKPTTGSDSTPRNKGTTSSSVEDVENQQVVVPSPGGDVEQAPKQADEEQEDAVDPLSATMKTAASTTTSPVQTRFVSPRGNLQPAATMDLRDSSIQPTALENGEVPYSVKRAAEKEMKHAQNQQPAKGAGQTPPVASWFHTNASVPKVELHPDEKSEDKNPVEGASPAALTIKGREPPTTSTSSAGVPANSSKNQIRLASPPSSKFSPKKSPKNSPKSSPRSYPAFEKKQNRRGIQGKPDSSTGADQTPHQSEDLVFEKPTISNTRRAMPPKAAKQIDKNTPTASSATPTTAVKVEEVPPVKQVVPSNNDEVDVASAQVGRVRPGTEYVGSEYDTMPRMSIDAWGSGLGPPSAESCGRRTANEQQAEERIQKDAVEEVEPLVIEVGTKPRKKSEEDTPSTRQAAQQQEQRAAIRNLAEERAGVKKSRSCARNTTGLDLGDDYPTAAKQSVEGWGSGLGSFEGVTSTSITTGRPSSMRSPPSTSIGPPVARSSRAVTIAENPVEDEEQEVQPHHEQEYHSPKNEKLSPKVLENPNDINALTANAPGNQDERREPQDQHEFFDSRDTHDPQEPGAFVGSLVPTAEEDSRQRSARTPRAARPSADNQSVYSFDLGNHNPDNWPLSSQDEYETQPNLTDTNTSDGGGVEGDRDRERRDCGSTTYSQNGDYGGVPRFTNDYGSGLDPNNHEQGKGSPGTNSNSAPAPVTTTSQPSSSTTGPVAPVTTAPSATTSTEAPVVAPIPNGPEAATLPVVQQSGGIEMKLGAFRGEQPSAYRAEQASTISQDSEFASMPRFTNDYGTGLSVTGTEQRSPAVSGGRASAQPTTATSAAPPPTITSRPAQASTISQDSEFASMPRLTNDFGAGLDVSPAAPPVVEKKARGSSAVSTAKKLSAASSTASSAGPAKELVEETTTSNKAAPSVVPTAKVAASKKATTGAPVKSSSKVAGKPGGISTAAKAKPPSTTVAKTSVTGKSTTAAATSKSAVKAAKAKGVVKTPPSSTSSNAPLAATPSPAAEAEPKADPKAVGTTDTSTTPALVASSNPDSPRAPVFPRIAQPPPAAPPAAAPEQRANTSTVVKKVSIVAPTSSSSSDVQTPRTPRSTSQQQSGYYLEPEVSAEDASNALFQKERAASSTRDTTMSKLAFIPEDEDESDHAYNRNEDQSARSSVPGVTRNKKNSAVEQDEVARLSASHQEPISGNSEQSSVMSGLPTSTTGLALEDDHHFTDAVESHPAQGALFVPTPPAPATGPRTPVQQQKLASPSVEKVGVSARPTSQTTPRVMGFERVVSPPSTATAGKEDDQHVFHSPRNAERATEMLQEDGYSVEPRFTLDYGAGIDGTQGGAGVRYTKTVRGSSPFATFEDERTSSTSRVVAAPEAPAPPPPPPAKTRTSSSSATSTAAPVKNKKASKPARSSGAQPKKKGAGATTVREMLASPSRHASVKAAENMRPSEARAVVLGEQRSAPPPEPAKKSVTLAPEVATLEQQEKSTPSAADKKRQSMRQMDSRVSGSFMEKMEKKMGTQEFQDFKAASEAPVVGPSSPEWKSKSIVGQTPAKVDAKATSSTTLLPGRQTTQKSLAAGKASPKQQPQPSTTPKQQPASTSQPARDHEQVTFYEGEPEMRVDGTDSGRYTTSRETAAPRGSSMLSQIDMNTKLNVQVNRVEDLLTRLGDVLEKHEQEQDKSKTTTKSSSAGEDRDGKPRDHQASVSSLSGSRSGNGKGNRVHRAAEELLTSEDTSGSDSPNKFSFREPEPFDLEAFKKEQENKNKMKQEPVLQDGREVFQLQSNVRTSTSSSSSAKIDQGTTRGGSLGMTRLFGSKKSVGRAGQSFLSLMEDGASTSSTLLDSSQLRDTETIVGAGKTSTSLSTNVVAEGAPNTRSSSRISGSGAEKQLPPKVIRALQRAAEALPPSAARDMLQEMVKRADPDMVDLLQKVEEAAIESSIRSAVQGAIRDAVHHFRSHKSVFTTEEAEDADGNKSSSKEGTSTNTGPSSSTNNKKVGVDSSRVIASAGRAVASRLETVLDDLFQGVLANGTGTSSEEEALMFGSTPTAFGEQDVLADHLQDAGSVSSSSGASSSSYDMESGAHKSHKVLPGLRPQMALDRERFREERHLAKQRAFHATAHRAISSALEEAANSTRRSSKTSEGKRASRKEISMTRDVSRALLDDPEAHIFVDLEAGPLSAFYDAVVDENFRVSATLQDGSFDPTRFRMPSAAFFNPLPWEQLSHGEHKSTRLSAHESEVQFVEREDPRQLVALLSDTLPLLSGDAQTDLMEQINDTVADAQRISTILQHNSRNSVNDGDARTKLRSSIFKGGEEAFRTSASWGSDMKKSGPSTSSSRGSVNGGGFDRQDLSKNRPSRSMRASRSSSSIPPKTLNWAAEGAPSTDRFSVDRAVGLDNDLMGYERLSLGLGPIVFEMNKPSSKSSGRDLHQNDDHLFDDAMSDHASIGSGTSSMELRTSTAELGTALDDTTRLFDSTSSSAPLLEAGAGGGDHQVQGAAPSAFAAPGGARDSNFAPLGTDWTARVDCSPSAFGAPGGARDSNFAPLGTDWTARVDSKDTITTKTLQQNQKEDSKSTPAVILEDFTLEDSDSVRGEAVVSARNNKITATTETGLTEDPAGAASSLIVMDDLNQGPRESTTKQPAKKNKSSNSKDGGQDVLSPIDDLDLLGFVSKKSSKTLQVVSDLKTDSPADTGRETRFVEQEDELLVTGKESLSPSSLTEIEMKKQQQQQDDPLQQLLGERRSGTNYVDPLMPTTLSDYSEAQSSPRRSLASSPRAVSVVEPAEQGTKDRNTIDEIFEAAGLEPRQRPRNSATAIEIGPASSRKTKRSDLSVVFGSRPPAASMLKDEPADFVLLDEQPGVDSDAASRFELNNRYSSNERRMRSSSLGYGKGNRGSRRTVGFGASRRSGSVPSRDSSTYSYVGTRMLDSRGAGSTLGKEMMMINKNLIDAGTAPTGLKSLSHRNWVEMKTVVNPKLPASMELAGGGGVPRRADRSLFASVFDPIPAPSETSSFNSELKAMNRTTPIKTRDSTSSPLSPSSSPTAFNYSANNYAMQPALVMSAPTMMPMPIMEPDFMNNQNNRDNNVLDASTKTIVLVDPSSCAGATPLKRATEREQKTLTGEEQRRSSTSTVVAPSRGTSRGPERPSQRESVVPNLKLQLQQEAITSRYSSVLDPSALRHRTGIASPAGEDAGRLSASVPTLNHSTMAHQGVDPMVVLPELRAGDRPSAIRGNSEKLSALRDLHDNLRLSREQRQTVIDHHKRGSLRIAAGGVPGSRSRGSSFVDPARAFSSSLFLERQTYGVRDSDIQFAEADSPSSPRPSSSPRRSSSNIKLQEHALRNLQRDLRFSETQKEMLQKKRKKNSNITSYLEMQPEEVLLLQQYLIDPSLMDPTIAASPVSPPERSRSFTAGAPGQGSRRSSLKSSSAQLQSSAYPDSDLPMLRFSQIPVEDPRARASFQGHLDDEFAMLAGEFSSSNDRRRSSRRNTVIAEEVYDEVAGEMAKRRELDSYNTVLEPASSRSATDGSSSEMMGDEDYARRIGAHLDSTTSASEDDQVGQQVQAPDMKTNNINDTENLMRDYPPSKTGLYSDFLGDKTPRGAARNRERARDEVHAFIARLLAYFGVFFGLFFILSVGMDRSGSSAALRNKLMNTTTSLLGTSATTKTGIVTPKYFVSWAPKSQPSLLSVLLDPVFSRLERASVQQRTKNEVHAARRRAKGAHVERSLLRVALKVHGFLIPPDERDKKVLAYFDRMDKAFFAGTSTRASLRDPARSFPQNKNFSSNNTNYYGSIPREHNNKPLLSRVPKNPYPWSSDNSPATPSGKIKTKSRDSPESSTSSTAYRFSYHKPVFHDAAHTRHHALLHPPESPLHVMQNMFPSLSFLPSFLHNLGDNERTVASLKSFLYFPNMPDWFVRAMTAYSGDLAAQFEAVNLLQQDPNYAHLFEQGLQGTPGMANSNANHKAPGHGFTTLSQASVGDTSGPAVFHRMGNADYIKTVNLGSPMQVPQFGRTLPHSSAPSTSDFVRSETSLLYRVANSTRESIANMHQSGLDARNEAFRRRSARTSTPLGTGVGRKPANQIRMSRASASRSTSSATTSGKAPEQGVFQMLYSGIANAPATIGNVIQMQPYGADLEFGAGTGWHGEREPHWLIEYLAQALDVSDGKSSPSTSSDFGAKRSYDWTDMFSFSFWYANLMNTAHEFGGGA